MQFKKWFLEMTGGDGQVGELRWSKMGDRSYRAAGIRSKWKVAEMKKQMKKMKK